MRLIDIDNLVLEYDGLAYIPHYDGEAICKYFVDQIKNAPTIDAEPFSHGEWISAKERMPEVGQLIVCVNCYANGPHYGVLRSPSWDRNDRYDYWMPLKEFVRDAE